MLTTVLTACSRSVSSLTGCQTTEWRTSETLSATGTERAKDRHAQRIAQRRRASQGRPSLRSLCRHPPHLLLLDEPSNHLNLPSVQAL